MKIKIEEEDYKKLVRIFNKYCELEDAKRLSKKELRELQYLIKTLLPDEKVKLFGLINIYQNSNDIYLNNYVLNLYLKLTST